MSPETDPTGTGPSGTRPRGPETLPFLHRWWGQRPAALARVATYLAVADRWPADAELLAQLETDPPPLEALGRARRDVRAAQAEATGQASPNDNLADEPRTPPRVLDPFAGAGSIASEAARLGCLAYASDLNPVAYHILRARLEYAPTLAAPDAQHVGTAPGRRWAGLEAELREWAGRLEQYASSEVRRLYADEMDVEGDAPTAYLWVDCRVCPRCGADVPKRAVMPVAVASGPGAREVLRFECRDGRTVPLVVTEGNDSHAAPRQSTCPCCGTIQDPNDGTSAATPRLAAVLTRRARSRRVRAATPAEADREQERLTKLRPRAATQRAVLGTSLLDEPLPVHAWPAARRAGVHAYHELFLPRQLLVVLEYAAATRRVVAEMRDLGIGDAHVTALRTCLAFFLGYLVEQNSRLAAWSASLREPVLQPRPGYLPGLFVERVGTGELMERWLGRVTSAIRSYAEIPPARDVRQADARGLAFESDYFDAVVTDPPFFDAIPYAELADVYWCVESLLLTGTRMSPLLYNETPDNRSSGREPDRDRRTVYANALLEAARETFRVLKPGRLFTMFLADKSQEGYDTYVDVAQRAGFTLVDARRVPDPPLPGVKVMRESATLLLYFRKPVAEARRDELLANVAVVRAAAEANRPVLYVGLAELLLTELTDEDIHEMLPLGAKGTRIEQLSEALADAEDLRTLLERYLGRTGIRRVVNQLGLAAESAATPLDRLIEHFGFQLPPAPTPGLAQVLDALLHASSRAREATDRVDVRAAFLDGATRVEDLLKLAVFAWGQFAFGQDRDARLRELLRQQRVERTLDRLLFGDIARLFQALPDAIAQSDRASLLEQKFGRRHIYRLKSNNASKRLDDFIALRNKLEHNKDGYYLQTPVHELAAAVGRALDDARQLLLNLSEQNAIPRVAQAIEETRDRWGRLTYRLRFDDRRDALARFSTPLKLGANYVYLGSGANPRPVDPLVLGFEELGNLP